MTALTWGHVPCPDQQAAALLDVAIERALAESAAQPTEVRLQRRYDKFRNMGRLGIDFVDDNGKA